MSHEYGNIDPGRAHLMAYEMRRFILDRMAEGYTVEMIDPKGDGTGSNE